MDGGGGGATTQIPPLNVKDRNYFISGPSPPFTQWVSTYLCEFMPSYCTPNPGAYLLCLISQHVELLSHHVN